MVADRSIRRRKVKLRAFLHALLGPEGDRARMSAETALRAPTQSCCTLIEAGREAFGAPAEGSSARQRPLSGSRSARRSFAPSPLVHTATGAHACQRRRERAGACWRRPHPAGAQPCTRGAMQARAGPHRDRRVRQEPRIFRREMPLRTTSSYSRNSPSVAPESMVSRIAPDLAAHGLR